MQTLKAHQDRVWQLSWHPQGTYLASCGADKLICIWRLGENQQLQLNQVLDQGHSKTVRCVAFSPNGMYLASGGFDALVCIWVNDNGKFKLVQSLEGHDSEVKSVGWSWDSKYLASCSRDKTVWIWDHEELEFQCNCILQVHEQDVKYVRWSIDSYRLFSASYDNTVAEFEFQGDELEELPDRRIKVHGHTVWCLDTHGDLLATVGADIRILKRAENENVQLQCLSEYHTEPIYSCSFSPDGHYLAAGSGDNRISLFACRAQDEFGNKQYDFEKYIDCHELDVNCVQFSSTGLLASCSDDETVKVHKV